MTLRPKIPRSFDLRNGAARRLLLPLLLVGLLCSVRNAAAEQAAASNRSSPSLDRAFAAMYNLDFAHAREESLTWQKLHPADPLGPMAEACGLLFSEFERLHVLQSEFFVSDTKFDSRVKLQPDQRVRGDFESALKRAEDLASKALLQKNNDRDSLFSLALINGLRADYAGLIEKRDFAALTYTKTATGYAEKLLSVAPDYYDGYLSTGLGNYILGSKPAPVRWVLRLGGFKANRDVGMHDLAVTAEHGRFLAPFARLLLAVAHLRDKQSQQARRLLVSLRDEFPANPLFAQEVQKIDTNR